jgi:hypothetical protein
MLRIVTRKLLAYLFVYVPFCLLVSLPILQAGYFSDDILNSLIAGSFANQKINFFLGLMQYMNDALVIGRFYPLSVLSSVSMFYLFPQVSTYQVVRLIFIWLSILSYAWIIKQITRLSSAAWLLVLFVPMCWSIRDMPDPIVSFAVLLPLLSLCMSLSVIFYINYQKSGLQDWRSWSLLMYIFALATYEFGVTTFCLLAVVSILGPDARKRPYRDLWPFMLLTVGYVAVNIAVRLMRVDGYNGLLVGQASGFIPTFIAQLVSSLPLSYRVIAGEPSISIVNLFNWISAKPYLMALMIYVFLLMVMTMNFLLRKIKIGRQGLLCLLGLGLTLIIIPSAIIATSSKYQHIISAGKGYLGVYLQYFGMSMLLIALISGVNQRASVRLFHQAMAVMLSTLFVYGWLLNYYVVMTVNNRLSYQRLLTESALQHRLLSELPPQAIIITPLLLWTNADFYRLHSGFTPHAITDINNLSMLPPDSNPSYVIDAHHLAQTRAGYVLLGEVKHYHAKKLNSAVSITDHAMTNGLKIFITANSRAELDRVVGEVGAQAGLSLGEMDTLLKDSSSADYPIEKCVTLPSRNYRLKMLSTGTNI